MFGSGYIRRKATYNAGKNKRGSPSGKHNSGSITGFTWGDGIQSEYQERAIVYDQYGTVEFDSADEFFASPWYRYMGDWESNGVIIHRFMLIPQNPEDAEALYRAINLPPPEEERVIKPRKPR